jgi:predicted nucleic-acid-binding protein
MIGLASNILVRYFAQDDPVQSAVATEVFEQRPTIAEPGFVSIVATAETIWVLQRAYRLDREILVSVLERLLQADTLVVDREAEVFAAMIALRDGVGQFSDALIGALSASVGCSRVFSFDQGALKLPGFEHP